MINLLTCQAEENGTCPPDFSGLEKLYTTSDVMVQCNASFCTALHANATPAVGLPLAQLKHSIEAEPNMSYCLRLDQKSPQCLASPDSCSVFYEEQLRCRWTAVEEGLLRLPLSEPIFVACVCGVLLLSLLLLLWTVVKCRKDQQQTPNPSPEPEMIKDKSMPRSLTIGEKFTFFRQAQ
jgi:hypothetical protein